MPRITLITGGMKSGKSAHALSIAEGYQRKLFVATAEPLDEEIKERIERHKKERDSTYTTVEEPIRIGAVLKEAKHRYGADVVIVDCLTLWLGNIFHKDVENLDTHIQDLLDALKDSVCPAVLVTNEIGMGVVPVSRDTRRFVDECGRLNRLVAALSTEVILMVSGLPLFLKRG